MFSRFFIQRPVFAAVLSIVIVLAGLVAMRILPIAQYPDIAPPTITITAVYPGASAETLAKTVAAPIEEQLSGIENLLYFHSNAAADGSVTITATFEVGTDPDKASMNVNNRVQMASPRLPDEVRRNGIVVAKRSNNFLMVLTLTSPKQTHDELYLSNFATQNLLDQIKKISGTADVSLFGARDYSMRIWLQPDKMAQLGVTTDEVTSAIAAQNAQYAVGKIGAEPMPKDQLLSYTVTAKGRLTEPQEFGNIALRVNGKNGVLRLKDIAHIELGAQSYEQSSMLNGKPVVSIGVFLQPGANALAVGDAVKKRMNELKQEFPSDVDYVIPYDTTRFVSESINEVLHTVLEAALIVLAVVFVFLQTWRATLIPMLAVPVSLIGTFAGLWLFGFSINTLTLFAMVLAIGIVVDDAIVVLENVERLMREKKMAAMAASIEAMREVSGAVFGIVLVLCAVFIPVAFMGGIAGQLYRQFAVTVAIAVVLSGLVALTLTPSLCALLLQVHQKSNSRLDRFFHHFNNGFNWLTKQFMKGVYFVIQYRILSLSLFGLMMIIAAILFRYIPSSFVPEEDQGYIIAAAVLPDGATLARTEKSMESLREQLANNPSKDAFFAINGFDMIGGGAKGNAATIFITLHDWSKRKQTAQELVGQTTGAGMSLNDGLAFAFNPPAIQGLGEAGGFEVMVQSRQSSNTKKLSEVTQAFIAALSQHPALARPQTFFTAHVPQLQVDVDKEKALALGVPIASIYSTLQTQMGSLYVNDFNLSGRTYRVTVQADARFRAQPEDLGNLYVRSQTTGEMIPLKALIDIVSVVGPEQIQRYNGYLAAKIMGSAKPGFSSGDAIAAVEQVAKTSLPTGYGIEWTGQAYQEKRTGSASIFAFGFAMIMVYLILSAMYERWGVPMAVALTIPFGATGALLMVWLRNMQNDIYFQIGLIVLIGLSAKNAILIAEFAMQAMEEGKKNTIAALEAAKLRFRPIVMTSLAFILGVVPLITATGAGAAARQSMGTGVFGGMLLATFIAPMFVPLFFTLLTKKPRPHHSPILVHTPEDEI